MRSLAIDGSVAKKALAMRASFILILGLATAGCAPTVATKSGQNEISDVDPDAVVPAATDVPTTTDVPVATDVPATTIVDLPDHSAATPPAIETLTNAIRPLAIAVCPAPLQSALEPWVQRRRREGMDVTLIESQPTATALKQSLSATNNGQCRYILLVGDAQLSPYGEPTDPNRFVSTNYRDADVSAPYQQSQQLPGDYAFGDFDDDGWSDAAVGRLPVKSADELTSLVSRIFAYEDSTDFGRWRSRVDLVAGIGGFGQLVDGAIEMVASSIITGGLPGSVRTRITHASPTSDFHPGMTEFTPTVLNNYRDGARFWVYAGHGWINELDRVPGNQFGRPVLSMSDLAHLQGSHAASPIALMLACYTGAFDAPEDCLAERMMLADNGPIAILAGSRVTMPYGNAATAMGLINAVYEERTERLGDAWLLTLRELSLPSTSNQALQTRRMMIDGIATVLGGGVRIDDERREHMQLYNWFGDPTLRIESEAKIEISKPADAVSGEAWVLQGTTPLAGELTIEVHRRLGSPLPATTAREGRYQAANDTVLVSQTITVQEGEWRCEFAELPAAANASIPIIIKADLVGTTGFATGSHATWLRPRPKPRVESATSATDTAIPAAVSR